MKCPSDSCRAYLNHQLICPSCDVRVCDKCHVIKHDDAHECNKDDVKSVKNIKENTRGCPKCGTRIYKVDGCDQMWCIECHIAFSWNTGEVVRDGMIHNPH